MEIKIPQLHPNNFGDAVKNIAQGETRAIKVADIGVIQSFDASTQTATVQIAIKRLRKEETGNIITLTSENYPLLVNVPVMFPGAGDWTLTFPVKKGDECLLIFTDRSIGCWKERGGVQDQSNYRRSHSLKDAIAIVGLRSKASSLPSFNTSEPELRNENGSVKLTMGSAGMKLTGDLEVSGNITTLLGDVTAGTVSLKTHIHSGVTSGNNISGPPVGV